MNRVTQNSKRLAYLLRHSCLPDHNGWVSISVLIQKYNFTAQELERIVFEDTKGRFEFSEDKSSVRALYGHSINVDLGLEPTMPPLILYHGTAVKYVECILKEGLKPRKRNYVHLSETTDMAQQVGARHGDPIVLSVDAKSMVEDGYKFYKAQRGVWLVDCVPYKYIIIMKYKIITERFGVEKLVEDIFLSDDKAIINIDYADLRTLRKISTLKYGFLFEISRSDNKFIEEILDVIKSQDIPFPELRVCLINIRIHEDETSLKNEEMSNLLQQIQILNTTNNIEGLWTLNTNSFIPLGKCYINIMFGVNKTDEDKFEDEKHEHMIEEYHKSYGNRCL